MISLSGNFFEKATKHSIETTCQPLWQQSAGSKLEASMLGSKLVDLRPRGLLICGRMCGVCGVRLCALKKTYVWLWAVFPERDDLLYHHSSDAMSINVKDANEVREGMLCLHICALGFEYEHVTLKPPVDGAQLRQKA